MKWLWAAAGLLLAAGAFGVFWAFQRPDFVVGLIAASVAALGRAVWPWIKKLLNAKGSEEQRKKLREGDTGKDGGR